MCWILIFYLNSHIDETPTDEIRIDIHSGVSYDNEIDHDYHIFPNVYTNHEQLFENRKHSDISSTKPKIEETKKYENDSKFYGVFTNTNQNIIETKIC